MLRLARRDTNYIISMARLPKTFAACIAAVNPASSTASRSPFPEINRASSTLFDLAQIGHAKKLWLLEVHLADFYVRNLCQNPFDNVSNAHMAKCS